MNKAQLLIVFVGFGSFWQILIVFGLGWVPLLSVCVCLDGFGHLAQVPHCLRPTALNKCPHSARWSLPMFSKRAPDCFDVNTAQVVDCFLLVSVFFGKLLLVRLARLFEASAGLQGFKKINRIQSADHRSGVLEHVCGGRK